MKAFEKVRLAEREKDHYKSMAEYYEGLYIDYKTAFYKMDKLCQNCLEDIRKQIGITIILWLLGIATGLIIGVQLR